MEPRSPTSRWWVWALLVAAGCSGSTPTPVCAAGKSEACVGPGGCAGGQRCNDTGTGFGPCDCAAPLDGGTGGGTGGGGTGGGSGGGSGGGTGGGAGGGGGGGVPGDGGQPDAGQPDAGQPDAGPPDAGGPCTPTAGPGANGCASGQKCAWVTVAETPTLLGELRCVPDGTVAVGGSCTQGPAGVTTGFDDCTATSTCINNTCVSVCTLAGGTECGSFGVCSQYADLFAVSPESPLYGACTAGCDPVAQVQLDGGSCGVNQGCYLLTSSTTTLAVCAGAGSVTVGADLTGTVFANSCVPGAQPRRRDQTTQVLQCGALCRPADVTSTTNQASEGGVVPFTCESRGAAPPADTMAGESCRYWWARESFSGVSPYSNTVGWCFQHAIFQYDSDGDQTVDAPWPRCITLTTGDVVPPIANPPHNDAEYFWCVETSGMRVQLRASQRAPKAEGEPQLHRLGGWRL